MMQNFAYEIAAAFFLAALLMGGTFLRGFFSQEILRGFKLAALGLVLAGAGLWIYRIATVEPVQPVQAVNPALDPVKQEQQKKRAQAVRDSDRKALERAMAEEAAKPDVPTHIAGPAAITTETAPGQAAPQNRRQRIEKSINHVLHTIPKP
jgi:hypothetical protein